MWTGLLKGLLPEIPSDTEILTAHVHLGGDKKKRNKKKIVQSERMLLVNSVTPWGPKHTYCRTTFFLSKQNKTQRDEEFAFSLCKSIVCACVCVCVCVGVGGCVTEPSWTSTTSLP